MDFLSKIKGTISAKTVENLASFLGENIPDVESGLGLSLNSFLAGLLKYAHSDVDLKNIINVLNDGGHTGDIFNNIESFSSNFEKTQLLVTIGNNISVHFLGNKVPQLVEKISGISEVRKTSAASLLSLSAPIVLGSIGKTMKEGNLDLTGLRNHFKEINEGVINALPPAISNIFQFKKTSNNPVPAAVPPIKDQKEKVKTESKTNWAVILPWLILGIAGLSVLYYAKFAKKNTFNVPTEQAIVTEKTETDLKSEDFLPDSAVAALPVEKNVVPVESSEEIKKTEPETIAKPQEKLKVESPITPEKKTTTPTTEKKETKTTIEKPLEKKSTDSKPDEIKTPSGWSAINGNVFKKNSAEITSSSLINGIVNQLRNSSKTIKISPLSGGNRTLGEDRAYALREILIEKGISEDQITISSSVSGSNPNGIVYRIGN
jgi:OmpA-OmpF porin, OOP family